MIARTARWLVVVAVLLVPSASHAPPQPIAALAPFDIVVDGRSELVGIAVGGDGAVYVSDRHAGVVYRQAPTGQLAAVLSGLDRPAGLLVDPDDRLLVVEEKAGRVVRREPNGALTEIATGIKTPRWLALAPDGSFYVSAHRLAAPDGGADTDGRDIVRVAPGGTLSVVATGIRQLQGLAVVGTDLVAATKGLESGPDSAGALLRYPMLADGTLGAPAVWITSRVKEPVGLVTDRLGAVFVASKDLSRGIRKAHPNARLTAFAAGLEDPQGLALGADGSL